MVGSIEPPFRPAWNKNVGNGKKTYNSRYSLVVTDPTTNQPLSSLTRGERTGSRVFYWVWSYVLRGGENVAYMMLNNSFNY